MVATVYNISRATFESLLRQHQGSNFETLLSRMQEFVCKPLVCHRECQQLQGVLRSWRPVTSTSNAYNPSRRPAADDCNDFDMDD